MRTQSVDQNREGVKDSFRFFDEFDQDFRNIVNFREEKVSLLVEFNKVLYRLMDQADHNQLIGHYFGQEPSTSVQFLSECLAQINPNP